MAFQLAADAQRQGHLSQARGSAHGRRGAPDRHFGADQWAIRRRQDRRPGIKLCESYNRQYGHDYRNVIPTHLYRPGDNFHPENNLVIPALMRRIH